MGAILLLQECCRSCDISYATFNKQFVMELFSHFFKHMVHSMSESTINRRTNISVMAMETALLLLDRACEELEIQHDKTRTNKLEINNKMKQQPVHNTAGFGRWDDDDHLCNVPNYGILLNYLSDLITLISIRKLWLQGSTTTHKKTTNDKQEP